MQPLIGREAAARLSGMINPKYQVHGYSVDLTARNVYAMEPSGQVDFGGAEYSPAVRTAVASHRRRQEDRYEWWDLARGCYAVEFNESLELTENEIAVLEPDDRLLRSGAFHVTTFLRGKVAPLETVLHVGTMSMLLKQNARITRLRVFRFDTPGARRQPARASVPASTKPRKGKKSKRS